MLINQAGTLFLRLALLEDDTSNALL